MNLTLSDIASLATAAGIIVATVQLWLARRQSITSFEDEFSPEYRELAAKLPTKALLGEALSEDEHEQKFDEFYHYIDLCNEQVFLHRRKRITKATWRFWRDGIEHNLKRPAFKRAWSEIAARSDTDFQELREVFPPEPLGPQ